MSGKNTGSGTAPFDALTGLSERLRQAEDEHRREREASGMVHVELTDE